MANYDVDIKVALQGAQALKQLSNDLKAVTKEVGKVNAATIKVGKGLNGSFSRKQIENVDNYSKAVAKAERALRNAAMGTDAERNAVRVLVRARKEANEQLERQNKLLKEEEILQGVAVKKAITASNRVSAVSPLQSPVFGARNIAGSPMAAEFGFEPSPDERAKPGRFGSAVQAGAFPLLFGGGPAQALGGALGGFMTKNIFGPATVGLQVAGGFIDQTVSSLADLGRALESGKNVVSAYETAVGRLSESKKEYLSALEASGQKQKLYNEITKQAHKDLGLLGDLLILNAENAATFDVSLGNLVNALKSLAATPFIFLGQETFGDTKMFQAQEKLTQAAKDRINIERESLSVINLQAQTAEKQNALQNFMSKARIEELAAAKTAEAVEKERVSVAEIREQVQKGLKEETHATYEIEKLSKQTQEEIKNIERERLNNLTVLAREKAKIAAEDAKRISEQTKALLTAEKLKNTAQAQAALGVIQARVDRKKLLEGEEAALQEIIDNEYIRLGFEKQLLAVSNAKLATDLAAHFTEKEINDIINMRNAVLQQQSAIRGINAQNALKELQIQKELVSLQNKQQTTNIEQKLGRQIEDVESRLTTPFITDDSEMLALRIKQVRRAEDIQTDLNNALAVQNELLTSTDKTVRANANTQIGVLKERIALYNKLLPQLDAVEQAELRQQQILEKVGPIANVVAQGIVNIFRSLADGSMDAQEVFVNMLKAVADALAQQATQMIATYIALGIAKAFAFGSSGGGGGGGAQMSNTQYFNPTTGLGVAGPNFGLAEGGYVSGPTRAVVGEGGESEYVIPESKMRESMARYSRGARGAAVIPETGGSGTSGEGGGTAVAAPIDVRYTVERINNVDYVTADQFQAGMRQAANQGAKQGEQQTLKRLQMSSGTRRRLGM